MSGPQCCSNPPTLDPRSGVGKVVELAGFKTYVTGSLHSKLALLLVSDIFGYEAPNLRNLADKVAASGFYVVVPDFLYGDPYDPERSGSFPDWTKNHEPEKGFEDAKLVIDALKSKGFSAIGAAGFCWGGKAAVELAKEASIQAAVLLHPANVTVDDIKCVKVPIEILGGELDDACPPQLVKQFAKILRAKPEIDSFVKIFPNCPHGWTLRYDVDDPIAVAYANEAHQNMLDWFAKYVKASSSLRFYILFLAIFSLHFIFFAFYYLLYMFKEMKSKK